MSHMARLLPPRESAAAANANRGDYANVRPFEISVGPIYPGSAGLGGDLTGTDWGTLKNGIRGFLEEQRDNARSVALFTNYQ